MWKYSNFILNCNKMTSASIDLTRGCNNFSDDDEVAAGSRSPKSSPKIVKKSAEKARKQRRTSATPNIAQMLKSSFNPAGFFKQGEDEASPFTEVKEAFDCIDEDGDGQISLDDLSHFMSMIGMGNTTQSELAEMITDHDTDGDGFLNYHDFCRVLNMELFECDQDLEIIRDALRQFDPDGLGFINEQDMRILMQQAGSIDQLNSEEMEELMAECEINDEGNINYETLLSVIKSGSKKLPGRQATFDQDTRI
ncbi:calmodulin-beta-like [Symsagittifera roscoffensis]|uniref:calmodulin-beta-like n=1 Tax=Symsagittifera roscoffensis TaxID=84072 RepID=UPI00307B94B6